MIINLKFGNPLLEILEHIQVCCSSLTNTHHEEEKISHSSRTQLVLSRALHTFMKALFLGKFDLSQ